MFLYRFYLREILRSRMFLLCTLLMVVSLMVPTIGAWTTGRAEPNYVLQFEHYSYIEVVIFNIFFLFCAWFYHRKSDLEGMAFVPEVRVLAWRACAILTVAAVYLLLPVGYMLLGAATEHTEIGFTLRAVLYGAGRWLMLFCVAHGAAMILSQIFQTSVVYLTSVPVTLFFTCYNELLFGYILPFRAWLRDVLSAAFSVQRPWVHTNPVDFTGPRIDAAFWWKLAYTMLFVAAAMLFLLAVVGRKKRGLAAACVLALFLGAGSARQWGMYAPRFLPPSALALENRVADVDVLAIRGEVHLGRKLQAHLKVSLQADDQDAVLMLDRALRLRQVTMDGAALAYRREGDALTVRLPRAGTAEIDLVYDGIVQYRAEMGVHSVFVTADTSALPAGFAYLPHGKTVRPVAFALSVESRGELFSNLPVRQTGAHAYAVEGSAEGLSLVAGYLKEQRIDGVRVISSRYDVSGTLKHRVQAMMHFRYYTDGITWETHPTLPQTEQLFLLKLYYNQNGPVVIWGDHGFAS